MKRRNAIRVLLAMIAGFASRRVIFGQSPKSNVRELQSSFTAPMPQFPMTAAILIDLDDFTKMTVSYKGETIDVSIDEIWDALK
jgi:hypothetical protein